MQYTTCAHRSKNNTIPNNVGKFIAKTRTNSGLGLILSELFPNIFSFSPAQVGGCGGLFPSFQMDPAGPHQTPLDPTDPDGLWQTLMDLDGTYRSTA